MMKTFIDTFNTVHWSAAWVIFALWFGTCACVKLCELFYLARYYVIAKDIEQLSKDWDYVQERIMRMMNPVNFADGFRHEEVAESASLFYRNLNLPDEHIVVSNRYSDAEPVYSIEIQGKNGTVEIGMRCTPLDELIVLHEDRRRKQNARIFYVLKEHDYSRIPVVIRQMAWYALSGMLLTYVSWFAAHKHQYHVQQALKKQEEDRDRRKYEGEQR